LLGPQIKSFLSRDACCTTCTMIKSVGLPCKSLLLSVAATRSHRATTRPRMRCCLGRITEPSTSVVFCLLLSQRPAGESNSLVLVKSLSAAVYPYSFSVLRIRVLDMPLHHSASLLQHYRPIRWMIRQRQPRKPE